MHHNCKAQLSRLRLAVSFAWVAFFKTNRRRFKAGEGQSKLSQMEDLVALFVVGEVSLRPAPNGPGTERRQSRWLCCSRGARRDRCQRADRRRRSRRRYHGRCAQSERELLAIARTRSLPFRRRRRDARWPRSRTTPGRWRRIYCWCRLTRCGCSQWTPEIPRSWPCVCSACSAPPRPAFAVVAWRFSAAASWRCTTTSCSIWCSCCCWWRWWWCSCSGTFCCVLVEVVRLLCVAELFAVRSAVLEWCLILAQLALLYPHRTNDETQADSRSGRRGWQRDRGGDRKIHQIQCECGKVQGYVHETKQVNEKILHTHAHMHTHTDTKTAGVFSKRTAGTDLLAYNLRALECIGMSCCTARTCCVCTAILSWARIVRSETFYQFPQFFEGSFFEPIERQQQQQQRERESFCWSLLVFICSSVIVVVVPVIVVAVAGSSLCTYLILVGIEIPFSGPEHVCSVCPRTKRGRIFSIFNAPNDPNN